MELFAKKIEKQLASYQQELIETHYRDVVIWTQKKQKIFLKH